MRLRFSFTQTMQINFYEVALEFDDMEQYLEEVERLVRKLGSLA